MRFEQTQRESPWRSGEGSQEGEEPVQIPPGGTGLARRLWGSGKRGKWGKRNEGRAVGRGEETTRSESRTGYAVGPVRSCSGGRQAEKGVNPTQLRIRLAMELKMRSREARMDAEMLVARTRVGAAEVWG